MNTNLRYANVVILCNLKKISGYYTNQPRWESDLGGHGNFAPILIPKICWNIIILLSSSSGEYVNLTL